MKCIRTNCNYLLGPLTRENTNIIVGVATNGKQKKSGKQRILRSTYTNVRDSVIQNWIQQIVPDLEINGRLPEHYF